MRRRRAKLTNKLGRSHGGLFARNTLQCRMISLYLSIAALCGSEYRLRVKRFASIMMRNQALERSVHSCENSSKIQHLRHVCLFRPT